MNLVFDLINAMLTFWIKPMMVIALMLYVVSKPDFRSAATSHWLLLLAVVSPVLLILLFAFLPRIDIGILPATLAAYTQAQIISPTQSPFAHPNFLTLILFSVYLLGLCHIVFNVISAILQTRQIAAQATLLTTRKIRKLSAALAAEFSVTQKVEIKVTSSLTAPVMWGKLNPQILLPAHFADWGEDRLRRVLAHEYAHIARGDWLSKLLSQLLCAVFWINPFMWRAAKQCGWHAELACDDLVVSKLQCRAEYADDLIELSTDASHLNLAALAFIKKSDLYLRINAILDGGKNRNAPGAAYKAFMLLLLIILLLPISVLQAKQSAYVIRETPAETLHVVGVMDAGQKSEQPDKVESTPPSRFEILTLAQIKSRYADKLNQEADIKLQLNANRYQLAYLEVTPPKNVKTDIKVESNLQLESVEVLPVKALKIVTPKYPKRALNRNLEATVVVTLDVDIEGKVKNPRIVSSDHGKYFNTSVLIAVKDFLYRPMMVNGQPIITRNVKETFVFTIEDAADTRNFR